VTEHGPAASLTTPVQGNADGASYVLLRDHPAPAGRGSAAGALPAWSGGATWHQLSLPS
jgi:hypothetical protein